VGEVNHRWPRFLPDGRTLFFYVQGGRPGVYLTALDRNGETQRIADTSVDAAYVPPRGSGPAYVLMVQGDSLVAQPFDLASMQIAGPAVAVPGAGTALTFTGTNRSNLSVANDGTVLYAAGSNRYQMTWFATDGTATGSVGLADRYVGVRISPDGKEALTFVDDAVGNRDLWRIDLTRGVRNRVTVDNRGGYGIWSPDGQRIAFTGLSRSTLFAKSASGGSGEDALLRSEYSMFPTDWSRDGKFLLYTQDSEEQQYDVWVLSVETGKATSILGSPAVEKHGGFSPDGRFMAFTSDESGRDEVYTQSMLVPTTRQRVSSGGGSYPRWSRTGNELFFRSLDGRLLVVPVRFTGTSVDFGEPRVVMPVIEPPAVMVYPYDVGPDGRVLALAPVAGEATHVSLNVLVDWQAALRR
jgi:Tol biopolymer transport system component